MSKYFPNHIANYFINKGKYDNYTLNKLVYIAKGFALATFDDSLFEEEVEAWKYGPVISSLYHEFKRFKDQPIDELSINFSESKKEATIPEVSSEDTVILQILQFVNSKYGKKTRQEFENLTHHDGSPWKEYYEIGKMFIKIPNHEIKKHFKALLPIADLDLEDYKFLDDLTSENFDEYFNIPVKNKSVTV